MEVMGKILQILLVLIFILLFVLIVVKVLFPSLQKILEGGKTEMKERYYNIEERGNLNVFSLGMRIWKVDL